MNAMLQDLLEKQEKVPQNYSDCMEKSISFHLHLANQWEVHLEVLSVHPKK
jgi:hypothetical protein